MHETCSRIESGTLSRILCDFDWLQQTNDVEIHVTDKSRSSQFCSFGSVKVLNVLKCFKSVTWKSWFSPSRTLYMLCWWSMSCVVSFFYGMRSRSCVCQWPLGAWGVPYADNQSVERWFNTWLGCSWLKQSAHLICIDVLVWDMSMNIILHHFWKKRQSEDCVVLGGDGHGLGQKNESLQSMLLIGRLKDQNEFYDAWNNYPRQSNLCSPTAVWLRTMSLTVPARRCNSANPCL